MNISERIHFIETKCKEKSIICSGYPSRIVADTVLQMYCPEHDYTWEITYSNLKGGKGCPKCAGNKKITPDEWFNRISERILNKSLPYVVLSIPQGNKKSRCNLYCAQHNLIWDCSLEKACLSAVCPECSKTRHLTTVERERNLFRVLPSHLHFSRWLGYVNAKVKVEIYCSQHDTMSEQWVSHVLRGHLPSCCTKYGFDFKNEAYIYILESDRYFKIGISNNVKQRIQTLKTQTPFCFKLLKSIGFESGRQAYDLELFAHKNFESAGLKNFDGCTEWLEKSEELKEWITTLK